MSKPLQPLSPDRLYKFAERMSSVEKLFAMAFSADKSVKTQEESDLEKELKFVGYRAARAKKRNAHGELTYEDVYDKITKEEMDYYLRKKLEVPPEQRYQKMKEHPDYHESSWFKRGLEAYDGQGCRSFYGCIPECRYFPDTGRIEDSELIKEYEAEILERRKSGTLIE
jgi:hypothetical protein